MSVKNKLAMIFAAVLVLGVPCISFAQTMPTAVQLQAQIQVLLAQIQALQQQLSSVGGSGSTWCHTFNTNLSIGQSGTEVTALQTALQKDGESVSVNGTFDDQTAAAVTGFQQKYASDILTPAGLSNGTGYAGGRTRVKLNSLFGCGIPTPTPTPIPVPTTFSLTPSSGPAGTFTTVSGTFSVCGNSTPAGECTEDRFNEWVFLQNGSVVAKNISFSANEIQVPSSFAPGVYELAVQNCLGTSCATYQVAPFTVTVGTTPPPTMCDYAAPPTGCSYVPGPSYNPTTGCGMILSCTPTQQPTVTVLSPNGGEQWQTGQTYPVTWSAPNIPQGTTVDLQLSYQLTNGGTYEDVIASGISNTGSYQWTIPSKYGTGMNSKAFSMRAILVGPNISGTNPPQDYSNAPFSIIPGIATTQQPSITSITPTSAVIGTQVTINGSNFGASNTVLFGGNVAEQNVPSNGTSLTFVVPQSVGPNCPPAPLGGLAVMCPAYTMLVSPGTYSVSVMTNGATSNSVPLTVTGSSQSSLNVTSPSAGQTFAQGPNNIISWSGGQGYVELGLVTANYSVTGGFQNSSLLGWITLHGTTAGSMQWTATTVTDLSGNPFPPVQPGQYRIIAVSAGANGNYCLSSSVAGDCNVSLSGVFTIAASAQTQSLSIASVSGLQASYSPGQQVSFTVNGIQLPSNKPADSGDGFNVQAYITAPGGASSLAGANGSYDSNTGLWNVTLNAPSNAGTYNLGVFLYCGNYPCSAQYPNGSSQVTKSFNLTVTGSVSPITVLSPTAGQSFSTGSNMTISWTPTAGGVAEIDLVPADGSWPTHGEVIYSLKVLGYPVNYQGAFAFNIPPLSSLIPAGSYYLTFYNPASYSGSNQAPGVLIGKSGTFTIAPSISPVSNIYISQNTVFAPGSVIAGSANVKIGSYTMSAPNSEGIVVNNLSIGGGQSIGSFQNLKILVNGVQFGPTLPSLSSAIFSFSGTPFTIPAGGKATIDVYADVLASGQAGSQNTTSFDGCVASGQSSYSVYSCGTATGQTMTITQIVPSGVLSVAQNTALAPGSLLGGSTNVKIGSYTVSAPSSEGVRINSMTIGMGQNAASLKNFVVVVAGVHGIVQPVIANNGTYTFAVSLLIPAGGSLPVDVYADVPVSAQPATTNTTSFSSCAAVGQSSNAAYTCYQAVGQTMTIIQVAPVGGAVTLNATAASLGATSGRAKSPADSLGTLTFAASNGNAFLNKITVTFAGSLGTSWATFLGSVQLVDPNGNNVALNGATVSTNNVATTVTWTFGTGTNGILLAPGAPYVLTLRANSTLIPAQAGLAQTLDAIVQYASDVQYSTVNNTGLTLPPGNVPLNFNVITYAVGT